MADMFNALMQGRQAGQQNRLAQIASQSYGAPQESQQSLLSQMAAIDPRAAQEQQGQFQQDEDRTGQQLRGYVEYVNKARASNNPMAVNAALRAGAPLIQRLTGKAPPTEWTPDMDAGWAELEARVAMTPNSGPGNRVQSQKVSDDGYLINTYSDGRVEKTDQRVDRQMWLRDHPGMPPELVDKNANVIPVGTGGQSSAAGGEYGPPAPYSANVGGSEVRTGIAGLSPEQNQRVAQMAAMMVQAGYPEAEIEAYVAGQARQGSEMASAAAPAYGNQRGANQAQVASAGSRARPSEAETAAQVEAAKLQTQIGFMPIQQQIETQGAVNRAQQLTPIENQGAIDRAVGLNRVESAAETVSAAPGAIATVQQSIDSIDALLNDPDLESIVGLGSVNPLNLVPGSKGRGLIARADQIAGQAFLAAFNQLKGGGAITEKEGEAATKAMARLDRSQNINDYKQALQDLKAAIMPALERQRATLARAQQTVGGGGEAAAPIQRARNPQTGEVLELRNGQWVPAR